MSIYITQQQKEEWETKVSELKSIRFEDKENFDWDRGNVVELNLYEELLSKSTVLPVEESWNDVDLLYIGVKENSYPNGVIIKKK
jgi:hypothetical protein